MSRSFVHVPTAANLARAKAIPVWEFPALRRLHLIARTPRLSGPFRAQVCVEEDHVLIQCTTRPAPTGASSARVKAIPARESAVLRRQRLIAPMRRSCVVSCHRAPVLGDRARTLPKTRPVLSDVARDPVRVIPVSERPVTPLWRPYARTLIP